ncbi:transient receptor potential cation channel subfamily v member 1 [Plakobranchus ocellatus]|uniref:Transient receptor potential cation channel subfamily v member 1 n=1 Tax=Plakobranchus ocellatus TaxID=259542 RepID=A0AAV4BFD0_9GAST|nr:transient receptor potential cation channel subfamily v member 1 [Plakobranchus ocellatus]
MLVPSRCTMKPTVPPKDGGRSAPSALPKGRKAQDSPAFSSQRAAEVERLAKGRAEKSKRQEASRKSFNRFVPLAMEAEDTLSPSWGDSPTPVTQGLCLSYFNGVPSLTLQILSPTPGGETPRSKSRLNHFGDLCGLSLEDSLLDVKQFTSKLLDTTRSSIPSHEGSKFTVRLHTVVTYRQFDLIMHPVFIRFLEVMWNKFGRFWALFNLGFNVAYIVMWTIIGIAVEYDKRHSYKMPDDGWRIFLYIMATLLTAYQIVEEVMEFKRSQRLHEDYERRRTEDINRDLKFCHPRWPEEEKYLRQEIGELQNLKPKYFSDMWNIFDWLCYVMLIVCMITHIADVISHTEAVARAHIRLMAVTIILLWLRLMKNARAFTLLGPFIVMLGHMLKDCVRFLFLYMEFYIPFLAAFWMMFGGTKRAESNSTEEVVVDGYHSPGELFFSMLRLTLVDEYDYANMQKIDSVMADLLLAAWFMLSAILCLNLFIALLSDTFQRVYDNAQANSVMQKAINILNTWDGISLKRKDKFLSYIEQCCSPLKDDYDDDMTQAGDEDMKKVTIQIKEDLDNFQEMFKLRFGDPYSQLMSSGAGSQGRGGGGDGKGELVSVQKLELEMNGLRNTIQEVKTQQDDLAQKMTTDMTSVKSMLRQLLGKPPQAEAAFTRDSPPPDYFHGEAAEPEQTPLSRMKRKKKKTKRPLSAGLEIDTLEDASEISSKESYPPFDLSEFSPGSIPDLTRTAQPQAFDVMLSPTSVPRPSQDSPHLEQSNIRDECLQEQQKEQQKAKQNENATQTEKKPEGTNESSAYRRTDRSTSTVARFEDDPVRYHIPEDVQVMLKDCFNGFKMRFSTERKMSDRINLEVGIAMDCTKCPILFILAMEVILRAAERSASPADLGGVWYMPPL